MDGLPQARRLSLRDAVSLVVARQQCTTSRARASLLQAFQHGEIAARGAVPLVALYDDDKAWSLSPGRVRFENLRSEDWLRPVDWALSRVGRYREISVERPSLERWLDEPSDARASNSMTRAHRGPKTGTLRRYEASDRALFDDLKQIMDRDKKSVSAAALILARGNKVDGVGAQESRAKRLAALYRKERAAR